MPAHKRSEQVLATTKSLIEACLREGYFPPDLPSKGRAAHTEAACRLAEHYGFPVGTAWKYIGAVNGVDYSLFKPYQYSSGGGREVSKPDGDLVKVCVIGDAHDSPSISKDRFTWMGRWVADRNPNLLVQIGDFCTLDSLTKHAAPGTKTFAELPSFKEDMDSLLEALECFNDAGWSGKKIVTKGNHEGRADRYEDLHPQMAGCVVSHLDSLFDQFGWRVEPENEIVYVQGVGFVHAPVNTMGRAYGGKTADQRAGSDTLTSLVHGHTHARTLVPSPKIGPMGYVDLVSVGCSLPHGHIEEYARHGPAGWWWGVTEMGICQGQIIDINYTSMLELERRYS